MNFPFSIGRDASVRHPFCAFLQRTARRAVPTLLLLFTFATSATAQQVSVQAYVDRNTVAVGESLSFVLQIEGEYRNLADIHPPESRRLSLRQVTPNRQSSMTYTLGSGSTRSLRLDWQFVALETGTAIIDPIRIEIDGQIYTTDPITVVVTPRNQPITGAPDAPLGEAPADIFLRAEPSKTTAHVGEQVVIDYILYYLPESQPRNPFVIGAWEAPGFWREDLELRTPLVSHPVRVGNRVFQAVTLRRASFFPTRSGDLYVDSLKISVDILVPRTGDAAGRFFNPFGTRYTRVNVASDLVNLTVLPLPDNPPDSFKGSTGRFSLSSVADQTTVNTGEPIRVTLTFNGDGNPATLEPPDWPENPLIELFPPRREVEVPRLATEVSATHTYTYTFVPHADSVTEIPALAWSYFDPETDRYRTLRTEPIPLIVTGEPTRESAIEALAEQPRTRGEPSSWSRTGNGGLLSTYAVPIIFGLPPLVLLSLLLVSTGRSWRERSAPDRRRRLALKSVITKLEGLDPTTPDYATSVDRITRDFLLERFDLRAHTRSITEIIEDLRDKNLPEEALLVLKQLLTACQTNEYAPHLRMTLPDPAETLTKLHGLE